MILRVIADAGPLDTHLTQADIDRPALAEWVDGVQTSLETVEAARKAIFTTTSFPFFNGYFYGASTNPGPRHFRIPFNSALPVGSLLVRGGGRLSYLAPSAVYPGSITNEADWIPAERLTSTLTITNSDVAKDNFSMWVFPPGTTTRALRFSHVSPASETEYGMRLSGGLLLSNRLVNIAPQSFIVTRTNQAIAPRVLNQFDDLFNAWDNGPTGAVQTISNTNFEWLIFTWPSTVNLSGAAPIWAGFGEGGVDMYVGPTTVHPRDAPETNWVTLSSSTNIQHRYPWFFWPNVMNFNSNVTTRALRLRMTRSIDDTNNATGVEGAAFNGRRVWLGEFTAFTDLGTNSLTNAIVPFIPPTPPIAVPFTAPQAGFVTLVIEDAAGKRVRNLVSETFFPAGTNVVFWDGLDESGRVNEGTHGDYEVQGAIVSNGTYRVRGLVRSAVDTRYEFTFFNSGVPPWETIDKTGGWLADHTPPSDVLFLPGATNQVLVASYVAESGNGLVWLGLDGRRKTARRWVGGIFTGASHLARDEGPGANTNHFAYTASAWEGALRLYALTPTNEMQVVPYTFAVSNNAAISGLAVHSGRMVASLPTLDQLLFIDVPSHSILGSETAIDPRGLQFETNGTLLAIVGNDLHRYTVNASAPFLSAPQVLVAGLDEPQQLTLDTNGNIYVSVRGTSHQVKVYDSTGAFIRDIGVAGVPSAGPYNEMKMHRPNGMAVTPDGRLWVAEDDYVPKRLSVWNLDGTFVQAFYGGPEYGGGGAIDPIDRTKLYHRDDHFFGAMEFAVDWATGSNQLVNIYHRPSTNDLPMPNSSPQQPLVRVVNGQTNLYLTDSFTANPVGGRTVAGLWLKENGHVRMVAAFGMGNNWAPLRTTNFQALVPPPGDLFKSHFDKPVLFAWSDLNGDQQIQTNEVQFRSEQAGISTVNQDLEFCTTAARVFAPSGFLSNSIPLYDLNAGQTRATNFFLDEYTTGSGQVLAATNGWVVTTGGPFNGIHNGEVQWTYPSKWPSLLAAVNAPVSTTPGEMIGTMRMLGPAVRPTGGEAGDIFGVIGDFGQVYLMTTDGLFLSTLFRDSRTAPAWSMPVALRDMSLNEVTLQQECFWPSINQTADGLIYLVAGHNHSSVVRLDGLTNVTRLATNDLVVTPEMLIAAANYQAELEALRRALIGDDDLVVEVRPPPNAPVIDGNLSDWDGAIFVDIDDDASGAVAVTDEYLYAAWKIEGAGSTFTNTGESAELLFKTGCALDLMIGADANADPLRTSPVPGDQRLLIARTAAGVKATLYRAVVPGTTNPVPFSSPYRTIYLDEVIDVSAQVSFGWQTNGNHEIRVPMSLLGFTAGAGEVRRGDIGILRGLNGITVQRVYWHDKSTGITADIPSEAELRPGLWGRWQFSGVTVPPIYTPFDAWRNARFAAWEIPSLGGLAVDADGDGIANLFEYGLNLDPRVANPTGPAVPYLAGNHLTLTYERVKSATDINYRVEVSGNLLGWNSGPGHTVPVATNDLGSTELITVSDIVAISATNTRFMRFRIEKLTGGIAVAITSPGNGSYFFAPASIPIVAYPTSGNSFINRVEFFEGTNKIGESFGPPFSVIWTNVPEGAYSLTALATDNLDISAVSAPVALQVLNAAPFLSVIADANGTEDTVLGPVNFTLGDPDTPISNLVLQVSVSNTVLFPPGSVVLGGTGTNRTLTLTPATNAFGSSRVTVSLGDGVSTVYSSFTATFAPQNDAPVANPQIVSTAEDVALPITLTGSDIENSPLGFMVVSGPSHGSLSGTAPNLTYTPGTNFFGSDSFTFKVNDGQLDSATATVSITISPVNDAPVANAQLVSTAEDTAKPITLTGVDVEGSNLTYVVVMNPTNGVLTGVAPNLTYTPATNFFGSDSFTFSVSDGSLTSAVATVSITVTPVNDAPSATPQLVNTAEDVPLPIVLTGADVEGSNLTFVVVANPTNGVLSGVAPNLTYTPATNFFGTDSFTFKANDGGLDSPLATISITVTPVNDAPFANTTNLVTSEDIARVFTLTGFDVEGSNLTFTVLSLPTNGVLSGTAPDLTYLGNTNFFGSDSFTFKVNDGQLDSAPATVFITVTEGNDAPTAIAQSVTTDEDTAKPITLTGSDPEGQLLTFAIATPPQHGSLSGTPPDVTYHPATNYFGPDSFTFVANDGLQDSLPGTISITVDPVNDAPVADPQLVNTMEDVPLPITLTGTDVEGSNLTYVVTLQPTNGVLSGVAPNLTYTPGTNFFGGDSFLFKVNDGQLDSAVVTVSITVSAVNDAPVANPQLVGTAEDVALPIVLTGSDAEGSNLTYTVTLQPTNGVLTGVAPNLTYTPGTNFFGSDSFTFKVNDGQLDSATATVSITVTPVNDAPIAFSTNVITSEDFPLPITLTGVDVEGSNLTYVVVMNPTNGVLTGVAPNLTYTPATNFAGSDSFTFRVSDGALTSAVATVSITVTPFNDSPSVALTSPTNGASFITPTNLTLTATASDPDGTITKVEFFAGAVKIGEDTVAPYSIIWTNPAVADYALTAVATDNGGLSTTSAVANVSVIWFRGINLNGNAGTIEGRPWLSYAQAQSSGLSVSSGSTGSTSVTPSPNPDADTRNMLQTLLYRINPGNGNGFTLNQTLPNGSYKVYVWAMENFQNNFRDMSVQLEGAVVANGIGDLPVGQWQRYGPYSVTVSDGTLNIGILRTSKGDPLACGVVIVSSNGNSGAP